MSPIREYVANQPRPEAAPRAENQPAATVAGAVGGSAGLVRRRLWPILSVAAGVALAVLASLFYLSRSTPASVREEIRRELDSGGLSALGAGIDSDWAVTLSGSVIRLEDKERAVALVRAHKQVRSVVDAIQVVEQSDAIGAPAALPSSEDPDQVGESQAARTGEEPPASLHVPDEVKTPTAPRGTRGAATVEPGVRVAKSSSVAARTEAADRPIVPSSGDSPRPAPAASESEGEQNPGPAAASPGSSAQAFDSPPPIGTTVDQINQISDLIATIERLSKQALKAHELAGREDDSLGQKLDDFVEGAQSTRRAFRKATGTGFSGVVSNVTSALRRNRAGRDADSRVLEISVADLVRRAGEIDSMNAAEQLDATTLEYWQEVRRTLTRLASLVGTS